jgi:hypothetical protein
MKAFLRENGTGLSIWLIPSLIGTIGVLFSPAAQLWWLLALVCFVLAPIGVAVMIGLVVGLEAFWERVTR